MGGRYPEFWLTQRPGLLPGLQGFAWRVGCFMVLGREQEIAEYSTVALGAGRDAPPPVSSRLWIRNGRKDVFKEIAFFVCLV